MLQVFVKIFHLYLALFHQILQLAIKLQENLLLVLVCHPLLEWGDPSTSLLLTLGSFWLLCRAPLICRLAGRWHGFRRQLLIVDVYTLRRYYFHHLLGVQSHFWVKFSRIEHRQRSIHQFWQHWVAYRVNLLRWDRRTHLIYVRLVWSNSLGRGLLFL